jgi:hypothetical protein
LTGEIERYGGGGLDLEVIRDQFAPNATNLELEYFAGVCRHLDLDPWAGHIYLIGRRQKIKDRDGHEIWRLVHKPQISVAGRRAIASRTGRLVGVDGPYWCGPRRFDDTGAKLPLDWTDLWDDDDEYPYAARCLVWPAGWRLPANGVVKWSEFAVYDDAERTRLGKFWKQAPSHMIGKVAESLALRRAFPEVEAAVAYVDSSMESDDAAIVAEAAAGRDDTRERNVPEIARAASAGNLGERSRPPGSTDSPPPEYYDQLPESTGAAPVGQAGSYDR